MEAGDGTPQPARSPSRTQGTNICPCSVPDVRCRAARPEGAVAGLYSKGHRGHDGNGGMTEVSVGPERPPQQK